MSLQAVEQAAPELQVRAGVPEDEEQILALCELLHEENGLFTFAAHRVRLAIRRAVLKERAIIGVVQIGDRIAGAVLLCVDQPWYSDDTVVEELFNYVHPDFRKYKVARTLITWAKSCSDRLAAPLLIGILSNIRTEAKVRLYRQQLEPAGAFFIHNRNLASGKAAPHAA